MTQPAHGLDRLETPERVDLVVDLAGIGSRGLAQIVDLLLVTAGLAVAALALGFFSSVLGMWSFVLFFALALLITWFYFAIFEILWEGQTPGKRTMHLRVQRVGGYPIGWTEAVLRNLLRPVDLLVGGAVGVLAMLLTSRSQRLGDLVAGTVVVRESGGETVRLEELGYDAGLSGAAPGAQLSTREFELLHDFLARRPRLEPEAAERIERRLAETLRARMTAQGGMLAEWRSLSNEAFLLHLDAHHRGEQVWPASPATAPSPGEGE